MALAIEPEDETFQSKLNQESLKVAVEELNENEKDRKSAVQSFRHLIQQHKWLRTPTGKLNLDDVKKKFGAENVFRTIMLICEWLKTDEHVQVNGITMFIDCTNVTIQHHYKLVNLDAIKKMIQYYQNSLPSRNKGAHIYNAPPFFDAVWGVFSPFLSEKTKSRMFLHGRNLAKIYEKVDPALLPEEYLPDDHTGPCAGSIHQIVENMIDDMMKPEFRNYILDLSSDKYGVDLDKKKQSSPTVATFRKLNID